MVTTVEEFYNKEALQYDERRWAGPVGQYVHETCARIVAKSVPIIEGARYLEIGCGTGRFTVPLAAKGVDLTAVDFSEKMLQRSRDRLAALGSITRVRLLRADARRTVLPSQAFDVVFSFNVINHVPGYQQVIIEVARLVKPGGIFVVGYPSLWSLYLPYAAVVNALGFSLRRGVYTRWPSTQALTRQARTLGLEVERMYGMFHFPAIKIPLFASCIAAVLRVLGPSAETGFLRRVASTHIVTFRKRAVAQNCSPSDCSDLADTGPVA